MKERTILELSGEVWAELHSVIDSRRDRGDHALSPLDSQTVEAVVDVVSLVLARNAGKTICRDEDRPCAPLLSLRCEERSHRRRQFARRLGVTLQ